MMTFLNGGKSFLNVVNVRNACDCLCYSQIFAGYLNCANTMTEKWTNLKAATDFQNLCVFQTD